MDPTATFVLIHGSWQGAWAWECLEPMLRAGGHHTIAVDLPGSGVGALPEREITLDEHARNVGAIIAAQCAPVIVVAHSGGGIVASTVAEAMPERIAHLAYVAAFLLVDGESIASFYASHLQPWMRGAVARLALSDDQRWSTIDSRDALEVFYQCTPPQIARAAAERLGRCPEVPKRTPLRISAERFGRVPRTYVETLRDRSVHIELQRLMHGRTPCQVHGLDTDHAPQLSMPEALAALLAQVAGTLRI